MDNDNLQTDFIEIIEDHKKLIYKVSHMYCDNADDIKDKIVIFLERRKKILFFILFFIFISLLIYNNVKI